MPASEFRGRDIHMPMTIHVSIEDLNWLKQCALDGGEGVTAEAVVAGLVRHFRLQHEAKRG